MLTPRCWTFLLSAALSGCAASSTGPSPMPLSGVWGGEHVTLTVNDTSSHLEFDCAHGDIPSALKPAADRTFAVSGTFVREHGGPIREDEKVDGTFTLIHGAPGRLLKCL